MLHEQRDVFASLPERRQHQADHGDSKEEVLPELALLYQALQVLVGRHQNTDIHFLRVLAAHAVELPILEHTQQLALHGR